MAITMCILEEKLLGSMLTNNYCVSQGNEHGKSTEGVHAKKHFYEHLCDCTGHLPCPESSYFGPQDKLTVSCHVPTCFKSIHMKRQSLYCAKNYLDIYFWQVDRGVSQLEAI